MRKLYHHEKILKNLGVFFAIKKPEEWARYWWKHVQTLAADFTHSGDAMIMIPDPLEFGEILDEAAKHQHVPLFRLATFDFHLKSVAPSLIGWVGSLGSNSSYTLDKWTIRYTRQTQRPFVDCFWYKLDVSGTQVTEVSTVAIVVCRFKADVQKQTSMLVSEDAIVPRQKAEKELPGWVMARG